MALDVEQIFGAVDVIVKQRLQEVSFDKTIICEIIDDKDSGKTKRALMTVIPTRDYYKLIDGVKNIDKDVFFVVTDSYQLEGGF